MKMSNLILSIILVAQIVGYSRLVPPAAKEAHGASRGLRLYRQDGNRLTPIGSACPVSSNVAYTAKHVIDGEVPILLFAHPDYGYDFRPEAVIPVIGVIADKENDIAKLVFGGTIEYYFRRGSVPLPGATVIGSIPLSSLEQPPSFGTYLGKIKDEEGTYHLSTMLLTSGASGSCTLDSNGNAWAISVGMQLWGASDPAFLAKATRHIEIPKRD